MAEAMPPDEATAPPARLAGSDDLLALPAGHVLNEYRFEGVLGGGGFGITYLARDTHLDCAVAIKEYFPRDVAVRTADLSLRPRSDKVAEAYARGLQSFLEESRALANFHHVGIVRVQRYFCAHATAYMVMEYETGESLDKWLVGRLRPDRASLVRIVRPLLDGLEVIHNAGFLHRDIKPGNIYIRHDGSPVLLDFGSARRVEGEGGGQDLTAVISVGYAPAEQYHRAGHQGPWTDLYSLAAVMYLLVTGRPPLESLARMHRDSMPSAQEAGDEARYGRSLLRAIDWALEPDEAKRPRTVADFRRAFLSAAAEDGAPAAQGENAAAAMIRERGTVICATLFVADVPRDPAAAAEERARLTALVGQALAPLAPASRIVLNTSEGFAACFTGDPEDALTAATRLTQGAGAQGLVLRIGINLGPVQVTPVQDGRSRVGGDGITTSHRLMRLCEPAQILVARAYYEVILHIKQGAAACFQHLGLRRDSHERVHDLYVYGGEALPSSQSGVDPAHTRPGSDLNQLAVLAAEKQLALHMGPMARILVRKAVPRAADLAQLHEQLAALIPDAAGRATFLAAVQNPPNSTHAPTSAHLTRPSAVAAKSTAMAAKLTAMVGRPTAMPPKSTEPASRPGADASRQVIAEADLAAVEKRLARHIGPMARVLVKREAARAERLDMLCRALAAHIDKDTDRQRFLAESGLH